MKSPTENDLYHLLYQETPSLYLVLDENLVIRKINRFGSEYLGYTPYELMGKSFMSLCYHEEHEFIKQNIAICIAECTGNRRWECMRVRKDGSRFWVRDTVRVIDRGEDNKYVLISGEDISETHYLISVLEHKSATDELTGLYNRRKFDRFLEELTLSTQSASHVGCHVLLYIDLDQFKVINDTCGHVCGDNFLRRIASLFRDNIRKQDILARLGSDEFALILENCTLNKATRIAGNILKTLSMLTFEWQEQNFSISASIGGIEIDGSYQTADEYLNHADNACYLAKENGGNRFQLFDANDSDFESLDHIQHWYGRLQNALKNVDFVLYRQQILPLASSQGQGIYQEILIRLRDDNGEMILPGYFIPVAEHYHLSPRIDLWVTETLISRHRSSGTDKPVTYFVNLSGLTLGDQEFIDKVSELIRSNAREQMKICFEITETTAIRNLGAALNFIQHFKKLGCLFALDDFGSGFSSFGYLKTLPVDFIKIDGSFVQDITRDTLDKSVVQAIHQVACVFGKQTIAEFVETQDALDMLKDLGVDFVQGFHIDKPSPLSWEDQ
ncbi:MAG: EAL domain-containing protein [Candidatus Thiodiazotropha taylori]